MSHLRELTFLGVIACAFGLAACGSGQPGQTTASSGAPPAVTPPAAGQHYQASIALYRQPEITADGQNILVTVNVTNDGSGAFGSATEPDNVNLGAHSMDASGHIVNNDLARGHLPQIAPGVTAKATILLPIAGTMGYRVELLPVQEHVAWFDAWGTKPLTIGPFETCSDAAEGKVCEGGKPLATASP